MVKAYLIGRRIYIVKVFIGVVGGFLILILYSCCRAASLYDYRKETPLFMFGQVNADGRKEENISVSL